MSVFSVVFSICIPFSCSLLLSLTRSLAWSRAPYVSLLHRVSYCAVFVYMSLFHRVAPLLWMKHCFRYIENLKCTQMSDTINTIAHHIDNGFSSSFGYNRKQLTKFPPIFYMHSIQFIEGKSNWRKNKQCVFRVYFCLYLLFSSIGGKLIEMIPKQLFTCTYAATHITFAN